MNNNFTTTFTVDRTPEEVFAAINDVRGWWTGEIDGSAEKVGDEFTYRYQDLHRSIQRVAESVPGRRVVWHVEDADLSFIEDKSEWTGTDITFDISEEGGKTEVRFEHVGLVPEIECFEACSTAWRSYIGDSLRAFVTSGAQVEAKE